MYLLTNTKIVVEALIIDEADVLQEELINKNEGTEVLNTHVEHEGTLVHKASPLKNSMSGSTCTELLDRIK